MYKIQFQTLMPRIFVQTWPLFLVHVIKFQMKYLDLKKSLWFAKGEVWRQVALSSTRGFMMCQFLLIFLFYPQAKNGNFNFEVQQNFLLHDNKKSCNTQFLLYVRELTIFLL